MKFSANLSFLFKDVPFVEARVHDHWAQAPGFRQLSGSRPATTA